MKRSYGNDDRIVLVSAHAGPFRTKDAHNFTGHILDPDALSDSFHPAEQRFVHRIADDAGGTAGAYFTLQELAPGSRVRVSRNEIIIVGADHGREVAFASVNHSLWLETGATAFAPARSAFRAATSRRVKGLASELARPGPNCPGATNRRLLPSREISSLTWAVVPLPIVTMAITAATPMTIPSIVRVDLSALRLIACMRELECFQQHQAAFRCRVGTHLPIDEADHAARISGDILLMGDHDDRDAVLHIQAGDNSMISRLVLVSRLPVGSSARSTAGSVTIARAMATRCC